MIDVENILKCERKLKIMTGLGIEELESIVDDFAQELEKIRNPKALKTGAPPKLNVREKLFVTLFYYRHYQNFDVIGITFGIDGSTVKRCIDVCEDALKTVLQKKIYST